MPLLSPGQLAEQVFQLVYNVPGLTFADVAGWDFQRRQQWVRLLNNQRRLEEEAFKKIPRK